MKPVLKSATSTCPQCGAEARPMLSSFAGPAHCKNCGTYFVIEHVFKMPEPAPASTEPPNPLLLENLKRPSVDGPLANSWSSVGGSIVWIIISSLLFWAGMSAFTWQNRAFLSAARNPSVSAIKAAFQRPIAPASLVFPVISGLLLLFGLWLLVSSLRGVNQLNRLRSEGCQAEGVMFDRWLTTSPADENNMATSTSYYVAFAFRVPARGSPMDGKVITRAELNEKAFDRYHTGDPLTVRYLPDDPSICEVVMDG